MKKTTKVVLGSAMSIAMCASLIAGSTLALFSSEDSVNIAVTSGKVDVTATIDKDFTTYSYKEDSSGTYVSTEMPSGQFIFGTAELTDDGHALELTNIVPGDKAEIKLNITNESTIAVKYQIMVTVSEDESLYKALDVKVGADGQFVDSELSSMKLSNWTTLDKGAIVDALPVSIELPYTYEDKILDGNEEGSVQGKTCKLTIAVQAVQANAHTTDPVPVNPSTASMVPVYSSKELGIIRDSINSGDDYSKKTIQLFENIDLENKEWEPIAGFKGTFEGNNQVISNIKINKPDQSAVGFFTSAEYAEIRNVTLSGVEVSGNGDVGALIGSATNISELHDITVTNVKVTGGKGSDNIHIGGVAGYVQPDANFEDGAISNITVNGHIEIIGRSQVGGAFGSVWNSPTKYPLRNITVDGDATSFVKADATLSEPGEQGKVVGGIVGFTNQDGGYLYDVTVKNLTVYGDTALGGAVGRMHENTVLNGVTLQNVDVECTAEDIAYGSTVQVGGVAGDALTGATITVDGGKLKNVRVTVPQTNKAEGIIVNGGEYIPSQVLGGKYSDTQENITLNLSGDFSGVTVNAKLKDVVYGTCSDGTYIQSLSVYTAQDLVNLQHLQVEDVSVEKRTIRFGVTSDFPTTINFKSTEYDLSGFDWKPLLYYSYGGYVYDGNGATIKNMTMAKAQRLGGFVDSLSNITVKNITFENGTLIGEQVGVVAGHTENGTIENVVLKGDISVSYGYEEKKEDAPGIGVFMGVTTNAADTLKDSTVAEGCVIELNPNGLTSPFDAFRRIDDNYLMGYVYNDAANRTRTGNTVNGTVRVNIANGLAKTYGNGVGHVTYVVSNADGWMTLAGMRNGGELPVAEGGVVYVSLEDDIDLKEKNYSPMDGRFFHLEGNGHAIENMTVTSANANGQTGLFFYGSPVISGLTLRNVNVTGSQAGAFCGNCAGAHLTNCRLEGNVNITFMQSSETWNALGIFTGIAAEGVTKFDNVTLASDAKVVLDFTGFTTSAPAVDFLVGYKAGGSFDGLPVNEGGSVEVKGLGNLATTGDGMTVDADADIVIDGGESRMEITIGHTAFNNPSNPALNKLEGIASGKIVIKNVDFSSENGASSYVMTLGFGFEGEVIFENCTFTNMYCAVYCNGHDQTSDNKPGNAHIVFKDCKFTKVKHVYGINYVDDLWNGSEGIKVEYQDKDGNAIDFMTADYGITGTEYNDPNKQGD